MNAIALRAEPLVAGAAAGPLLRLTAPLSFWGGVDPATGRITDVRHPQVGMSVAGRVLALAETRGSSSSSSIMLELIRAGRAPAAVLLGSVDAVLVLGILVAREMGWEHPPAYRLDAALFDLLPDPCAVDASGRIAAITNP